MSQRGINTSKHGQNAASVHLVLVIHDDDGNIESVINHGLQDMPCITYLDNQ